MVTHKVSSRPSRGTGVTEMMSRHFSVCTDALIPAGTSSGLILLAADPLSGPLISSFSSDILQDLVVVVAAGFRGIWDGKSRGATRVSGQ